MKKTVILPVVNGQALEAIRAFLASLLQKKLVDALLVPLELPTGVVWCYVLVHGAAVARVATPFAPGEDQRVLLLASALAWAAAFALFAVRYWPILTSPRPDGKPG